MMLLFRLFTWRGPSATGGASTGVPTAASYRCITDIDMLGHRPTRRQRGQLPALLRASQRSGMDGSVEKGAKNLASKEVRRPMFEEIVAMLTLSSFVYIFAECRKMSSLGRTPHSLEGLMLESDRMNVMDIVRGTPHRIPAYATEKDGGDGWPMRAMQVFSVILEVIMADQFHAASYAEAFAFLNGLCKASLKSDLEFEEANRIADDSNVQYIISFINKLEREANRGNKSCVQYLKAIKERDVPAQTKLIPLLAEEFFRYGSPLYKFSMAQKDKDGRIVWINDKMGHEECVYVIAVDRNKKRVTVIFRGTTTFTDMLKNTDFSVMSQTNPILEDYPGKTKELSLNRGYGEYLFVPRKDTLRTKYDEIADRAHEYGEVLSDGYSLYVTGHSMGGALASMFGFYASTDVRFAQKGNPVRVYTFAAAIPGRISFAKAFQCQERAGLLQHARVTNQGDVVPLMHPQTQMTFAHTGINICLDESGEELPSITYVNDVDWWGTWRANIQTNMWVHFPWLCPKKVGKNHSPNTIGRRLFKVVSTFLGQSSLGSLTIEDYYDRFGQTQN